MRYGKLVDCIMIITIIIVGTWFAANESHVTIRFFSINVKYKILGKRK